MFEFARDLAHGLDRVAFARDRFDFKPDSGQRKVLISTSSHLAVNCCRQSHRGKGLSNVRRVVDRHGSGRLRILSNRGEYRYATANGRSFERLIPHETSIGGTLIEWELHIGR